MFGPARPHWLGRPTCPTTRADRLQALRDLYIQQPHRPRGATSAAKPESISTMGAARSTVPAGFDRPAASSTSFGLGNVELAVKRRFLHQDSFGLDVSFFPGCLCQARRKPSATMPPRRFAGLGPEGLERGMVGLRRWRLRDQRAFLAEFLRGAASLPISCFPNCSLAWSCLTKPPRATERRDAKHRNRRRIRDQ